MKTGSSERRVQRRTDTVVAPPPCVYLGIDPGASGGLAALANWKEERLACSMPATDMDVWDWLHECELEQYRRFPNPSGGWYAPLTYAVLEKVGGHIGGGPVCPVCKQARNKSPGSAMFKFGAGYGALKMALTAAGIPFEEMTPQAWQAGLSIPRRKKNESRTEFKNRLKTKAQQLFPDVKVTLATADALLIAEYCRRKQEGKL